MRKIINRYIFKEITFPFFIILFVLTFVLLMGKILQIMDLMVNKGIGVLVIAKIIIFLLPSFMVFTIPIALLIAILMAMGRLSADNEITVFRASGVSLMQLYHPVAAASLIAFVFTLIISYFLVPQSNFATKRLLFDIAQQNAGIGIKEKVFNDDFKGMVLYAEKIPVDGEHMEGVIIYDSRFPDKPNTIVARKAFLVSDPASFIIKLRLEDGAVHTVSPDLKNYRKIDFKTYDINLDLSTSLANTGEAAKSSKDMTMYELLEKRKTPGLDKELLREFSIELHKKFAIPLSCIFFAIIALPLGIKSHRAVKSRGFAVGVIIVSLYYLLRLGGEALAETGRLSAAIGVWMPNFIFAVMGLYLFYMACKEISLWHEIKIRLWRNKLVN
ncbi:MAG: LPS export ABC transporter permease LptF [Smithellaceae bacterium]